MTIAAMLLFADCDKTLLPWIIFSSPAWSALETFLLYHMRMWLIWLWISIYCRGTASKGSLELLTHLDSQRHLFDKPSNKKVCHKRLKFHCFMKRTSWWGLKEPGKQLQCTERQYGKVLPRSLCWKLYWPSPHQKLLYRPKLCKYRVKMTVFKTRFYACRRSSEL